MPAEYTAQGKIKKAKPDGAGGFVSDLPLSAPGAPSFTVSKTSSSITATITDTSGATSYESSVDGTNWVSGRTVTGLTAETAYTFQIRGINSAGTGPSASQSVTTNAVTVGAPSVSTVTDNGDGTISITGSNFGTKAQAAPLLHDIGGNAWENGVLNTFYADQVDGTAPADDLPYPNASAPYVTFNGGNSSDIAILDKSSPFRQASQGCNYFFSGAKARLGQPTVYKSGSNNERKLYWAVWQKYRYFWYIVPVRTSNLSGPFIKDEPVTVNGVDNGDRYIGYYAPADQYYFETQDLNPLSAGDVIVGQTSGESMTLDSTLFSSGKISRLKSDYAEGALKDNARGSDSDNSFYVGSTSLNEVNDLILRSDNITDWTLFEYEIEYFPATEQLVWKNVINGRVRTGQPVVMDLAGRGDVYGLTISLWGLDSSARSAPQEITMAEAYMDNSFQRVYLADASTWSAVTHRELQRPTSWADGAVTVAKNDGTLAGTKWAYVVGPDGSVNENGVQV